MTIPLPVLIGGGVLLIFLVGVAIFVWKSRGWKEDRDDFKRDVDVLVEKEKADEAGDIAELNLFQRLRYRNWKRAKPKP